MFFTWFPDQIHPHTSKNPLFTLMFCFQSLFHFTFHIFLLFLLQAESKPQEFWVSPRFPSPAQGDYLFVWPEGFFLIPFITIALIRGAEMLIPGDLAPPGIFSAFTFYRCVLPRSPTRWYKGTGEKIHSKKPHQPPSKPWNIWIIVK